MFRIAAVTASLAAFASVASASPIVVVQELGAGQPRAAKLAAKAAVLAGLGPYAILEDFEDLASSNTDGYATLATGAGTFSVTGANGTGSGCIKADGNPATCDQLFVLDEGNSPFYGRFNTTPGLAPGDGNWLDSNDIRGVTLDLTGDDLNRQLDSLFFFLSDVSDQGGTLTVRGFDGSFSQQSISGQTSGDLYFVRISSLTGISQVSWSNSLGSDGFGIDDIGTTSVPEPMSVSMLGIALLGAAARLRRRR